MGRSFIYAFSLCISSFCFAQKIAGPLIIEPEAAQGLTLISPLNSNTTYLIDNCGRVINTWVSDHLPGYTAYLQPNGTLVRPVKLSNTFNPGAGSGGGVELFDWNSNLIWSTEFNSDSLRYHHDIEVLPNGNILMILWETKTAEDALARGRDPMLIPIQNRIWSERIVEVKPIPPDSSVIVWQWSVWDHLIQDFDASKQGFGVVSDHPERIDINYTTQTIPDWIHMNSVDYNQELDQIILSPRDFSELWVIDHSTTMEEAASSKGGKSNKGGDLLYRWGNPQTYKQGGASDQKMFEQHDVHWIEEGEQKGKIIFFNNKKGMDYSTVEIINPPIDANSHYILDGTTFGPESPELIFKDDPKEKLYSAIMAGAQYLPNGNLLICSSRQGFIYEVTPENKVAWYYKNPFTVDGIVDREFFTNDPNFHNDLIFRATKYSLDYEAFIKRNLRPKEPIEGEPWAPCDLVTSTTEDLLVITGIYPNPVKDWIYYVPGQANKVLFVRILNHLGQEIQMKATSLNSGVNVEELAAGLYFIKVDNQTFKFLKVD